MLSLCIGSGSIWLLVISLAVLFAGKWNKNRKRFKRITQRWLGKCMHLRMSPTRAIHPSHGIWHRNYPTTKPHCIWGMWMWAGSRAIVIESFGRIITNLRTRCFQWKPSIRSICMPIHVRSTNTLIVWICLLSSLVHLISEMRYGRCRSSVHCMVFNAFDSIFVNENHFSTLDLLV